MNIVLGVGGSIAAYRAADLARDLMRQGAIVRTCLTRSASEFVSPILFEGLTGEPSAVDVFDEPEQGQMAHIDWARWADVIVISPATASLINRLAHGMADDMLTSLALASECPLIVAPAMNPSMLASQVTKEGLERLRMQGAWIVEPTEGMVACREEGRGKLAPNDEIAKVVLAVGQRQQLLKGRHVVITSGPTVEPIDAARFLSNRSSGKMGSALAQASLWMGAQVTVIAGPQATPLPMAAHVVRVQTAQEMLEAALPHAASADLVIGAAAVADYRPANTEEGKKRRGNKDQSLLLTPNPDVIRELAAAVPLGAMSVAFAAEPSEDLEYAKEKIAKKGVDAIAVNDISRSDAGFGSDMNDLTLIWKGGREMKSGHRSKIECAFWLLHELAAGLDR